MIIAVLAFLGGVLTVLSPCILPVVPFVLARTDRPFARSTLPLLLGMAASFAAIATLAAVGGGWAVKVNESGRVAALVLLALSALALLSRRLAAWLTRPLVAIGARLVSDRPGAEPRGIATSLLLGVATGLLWAPCAGPILGLILTGAALRGPDAGTTVALLAYALGAAGSLAVVAAASTRVIASLKGSFAAGEWVRRVLGSLVLAGVAAIAFGLDTGPLTRLSVAGTNRLEQALLEHVAPGAVAGSATAMRGTMTANPAGAMNAAPGPLAALADATAWLNSPPLTAGSLRGKVVVIDFWTYSCINCLRSLPYVKSWYERYRDQGLVVIGVHAPEFAFEKNAANVARAVRELGISYPVALDDDYAIWRAFDNHYWPAHYFIDAAGSVRGDHFGEGDYAESEQRIRQLLTEAGAASLSAPAGTAVVAAGAEAAADEADLSSPETYIGYGRAERFVSPGGAPHDVPHVYSVPHELSLNDWALAGRWRIEDERAVAAGAPVTIAFRFRARDLHLVLGTGDPQRAVRFRVTIDGHAPGPDHGSDVAPDGAGSVREQRLYQLLRQHAPAVEHTFAIEFLDPGVQAYSFTFG